MVVNDVAADSLAGRASQLLDSKNEFWRDDGKPLRHLGIRLARVTTQTRKMCCNVVLIYLVQGRNRYMIVK